jgi:alpha-glucosidase
MYISIPFYIGIHHRQVYGLYFNNTWRTQFNFGISTPQFTSVTADGGDADYFFFYDTTVAGILDHYTDVTGKMPLPPKWSLGYHQSRCSYYPQANVELLAETFRRKQIPVDGIVLDADYQLGYQPFRINKERFPDLPALARKLDNMNISLTASVYPGVKLDSTYESFTDGLKKDVFIRYADGSLFETEIAPLRCYLPDYTNPKVRDWWMEKMKWMEDNGIRGYWNDMNEPAVGGSYLPDNLLFDFDGRKAFAPEAKNVYGFQMARSSYEAALRYANGKRPFVLTRSAFAGVQRYAAVWSGDNTASNEGLLSGVLLNNQMGLSGMPFVGPDLGGYIGDGSKDLFKRWMEVGVFSPYLRNHKEFYATANEPWSYGEEAEAISKTFIGFRYRLMPYLYSKFYEASQTGIPVARSLALDFPFDAKIYDPLYQYQFLFGDAMMVVPVTTEEKNKKVYLPDGSWYDLHTDMLWNGNREISMEVPVYTIPLFIKASSLIPVQQLVQSTRDKTSDTLQIHVFQGTEQNRFLFYEDAGDGNGYKKGEYAKRDIIYDPVKRQLKLTATEGSFNSAFKKVQWVFHGFGQEIDWLKLNGSAKEPVHYTGRLLDPLKDLADYYGKEMVQRLYLENPVRKQVSLVTDYNRNELIIQW